MYDFRLDLVSEWVLSKGGRSVALQLPEGLKTHALSIAEELEARTGARCIIIADPCYGACDLTKGFEDYADLIVQFGHAPIPSMKTTPKALFVEVFIEADLQGLLASALPLLTGAVGLLTTVQHVRVLPGIKAWLEANGHPALIGRGDDRIMYDGQVLGCNISSVYPLEGKADSYLYIGSGDFHPLSVAIETDRPVVVLDPLVGEVRELGELRERIMRQRHGAIVRAQEAQSFAVLVSTKVGQNRLGLANRLRSLIEEKGRKASLVVLEEFHPDRMLPFAVDAYVSTACPRVAIDDYLRYPKPLLTPVELEIVLGVRRWEDYRMDAILGEER